MGKRHRAIRAASKEILRTALRKGNVVKVSFKQARKLLRENPLGYKEDELGELRSTIRKLTEHEIVDRACARAMWELHKIEDANCFAAIDQAMAG
jgi:urease accessory protein UreE